MPSVTIGLWFVLGLFLGIVGLATIALTNSVALFCAMLFVPVVLFALGLEHAAEISYGMIGGCMILMLASAFIRR